MSTTFAAKRAQLDREAADIRAAIDRAVRAKSIIGLGAAEKRVEELAADRKELDRQEAAITTGKMAALRAYGGAGEPDDVATKGVANPARSPYLFPRQNTGGLSEAAIKRLPTYRIDTDHLTDVSVKSPFAEGNFTSGSLPPTLLPTMSLDLPYQPDRAFAHFLGMQLTTVTTHYTKIAALALRVVLRRTGWWALATSRPILAVPARA